MYEFHTRVITLDIYIEHNVVDEEATGIFQELVMDEHDNEENDDVSGITPHDHDGRRGKVRRQAGSNMATRSRRIWYSLSVKLSILKRVGQGESTETLAKKFGVQPSNISRWKTTADLYDTKRFKGDRETVHPG
jgi:hypothetical protein